MPRSLLGPARARPLPDPHGIKAGRRRAGRQEHARYYAIHNHPNQSEFGRADYVDAEGRQYRIAFLDRLDAAWVPGRPLPPRPLMHVPPRDARGRIKLWVKVPRRRRDQPSPWPSPGHVTRVALNPVAPGLAPATVAIGAVFCGAPYARTGHVMVTGLAL